MKILLLTEFFPRGPRPIFLGGVQARAFFVAEGLRKRHAVEVRSFTSGRIEASSVSLYPRLAFALQSSLWRPKHIPDLIEASNVTTYLPAFFLSRRLRVPAVAWVADVLGKDWWTSFPTPVAMAGWLIESLALKAPWDHYIAMSRATKKKLEGLGIDPQKVTVIYGGVDYRKITTLTVVKFRQPTICAIARLLGYKRINDLIEAINLVRETIPDIRCLIIGEGPDRENLKSQISILKLNKTVKLLGSLSHEETMVNLKRSHLFCLPSLVEGFGIVTVEAMAAGVPYVNSRIPATVEVTKDGQGGLLFTPTSVRELAGSIERLLRDSKLYAKKQQEGVRLAKDYDWAIIAKQTEAVYEKTISKKI